MSRFFRIILPAAFAAILVSCGGANQGDGDKLPKVKDSVLMDSLKRIHDVSYGTFYAKISTKYQDSAQNISFKTSVRMVEDSACNATVTFARIPIINSMITQDSIKFTNKRDKCYTIQGADFFRESFGVDFAFDNLEELFMGLPLGFDANREYFRIKDPYRYIMSTHRKKDVNRTDFEETGEDIIVYHLSDDLTYLEGVAIESPKYETIVHIQYANPIDVKGILIPTESTMTIKTPKQDIVVELKYSKTRIGEDEQLHFVIPESYDACK